jgi:hypothetical protein
MTDLSEIEETPNRRTNQAPIAEYLSRRGCGESGWCGDAPGGHSRDRGRDGWCVSPVVLAVAGDEVPQGGYPDFGDASWSHKPSVLDPTKSLQLRLDQNVFRGVRPPKLGKNL